MVWSFKSKNWAKLGTQYPNSRLKQILINGTGCDDIRLNDNVYRAIPYNDFTKLAWGGYDGDTEYEKESADCDDQCLFYESNTRKQWAKKAKGSGAALAFGQAKVLMGDGSQPHMLIWQVDNSGNINWIEGQTYTKAKQPVKVYSIEG